MLRRGPVYSVLGRWGGELWVRDPTRRGSSDIRRPLERAGAPAGVELRGQDEAED